MASLWNTDGCTSAGCTQTLGASSSLTQGATFAGLTKTFHGGSKKYNRKNRKMNQRGGMSDYPGGFSETLPQTLHQSAWVSSQDAAFAALPQFAGKYGMTGGRRSRRNRKYGGALHPADVTAPSMILTAAEEPAAFLNPQWYTENQVVPSFQGPQRAGRRNRKASKKSRKASKKSRKASKKSRKASKKANRRH